MPIHHATLHQLKIFDAVARHMSFARAAEELHLTPPALSIQVKQLAEAIGHSTCPVRANGRFGVQARPSLVGTLYASNVPT